MMSFIIWSCVTVGALIILHDLGMFGLYGRVVQNWLFAGSVSGAMNREVQMALIEAENNPSEREVCVERFCNNEGDIRRYMVIRDPKANRYGEHEEYYIFDVTGSPTTNPEFGHRYFRWSSSSRVLDDNDPDGKLNLSVNTKDRMYEMSTPDAPVNKKFKLFNKKMVHLS